MNMNEELICENRILNNNYKYYLTENTFNIESIGEKIRYGIKVNGYDCNNDLIDSKSVLDVFDSRIKMIKAICILKRLEVTPITLEDVIIDNIS